jgi:hypothetical protein
MRRPPEAGTSFRRHRGRQVQCQVWGLVQARVPAQPELLVLPELPALLLAR